jgi:hypothetical protein
MEQTLDKSKNSKATIATLLVHGILILILIKIAIHVPAPAPPPQDLGIEVNLGSSDQGLGTNQPKAPGDPAPEVKAVSAPAREQSPPTAQPNIQTDDNNKEDEPAVVKPEKHKVTPHEPVVRETARKITQKTIYNPTPTPPRPRAIYKGGAGTGGNNSDAFNKSPNEGIAGGKGDQGNPNGNPDSHSYTGNGGTGTSGAAILRGLSGRTFTMPSFEGDFNENQRVAVDLKVDRGGHVISAIYQQRGSTTANSYFINKAVELARKLKFNQGAADEQTGTIQFNFKVRE